MSTQHAEFIKAVESIMLEKYKIEPFHNLYILNNLEPNTLNYGGTCSDKTLSFLNTLRSSGYRASLHSGFIGGQEIHRLAKVYIDGQSFFADIGNGWPALKLYPLHREISYQCFGMRFRTEIVKERMKVFHLRNGVESCQLEIDFYGKSEAEIKEDIATRFNSGIEYPFSKNIRFSMVVGERFIFLRGERLEIYSDNALETIEDIDIEKVPKILHKYFGFDIEMILS